MEFGLLAMFIFFAVSMFDAHKSDKWFFFLVVSIGAFCGITEYVMPMYIPKGYITAMEKGITIGLMTSGFYGIAKKRMNQNQNGQ